MDIDNIFVVAEGEVFREGWIRILGLAGANYYI